MTMFGNNDRAVITGGSDTSPQRVKRFKTRAIGLALLSLTICQAAIAQEACPTGPKKTSGADGAWDIVKIRDFGLWMGQPEKQLMLCLHRGLHSNIDDNQSADIGPITRTVPEHSWTSIKNAFQFAPCVELDFQKRTLNKAATDAGSSSIILSHEAVGNRVMSEYTMLLGADAFAGSFPSNCDRATASAADAWGIRTVKCRGTSQYNPATDAYTQPEDLHKFSSSNSNHRSIMTGTLKSPWSATTGVSPHGIVNQKALMEWVNRCRSGGNVGLVVADIKTYESLVYFVSEMKQFMGTLSTEARRDFARYWMIKTKPWKMRDPADRSDRFDNLSNLVQQMKDYDIPVIDTIAQGGNYDTDGATVKTGTDADLAKNYYVRSDAANRGNSGRRAIEIVVPGNRFYDPIRAGKVLMPTPYDCRNTGNSRSRDLVTMKSASTACNSLPRSGPDEGYFPQIWGWVPLEDGRAGRLEYSTGATAVPTLPGNERYVTVDGRYPFGVASSNMAPFPFVWGKDTEERQVGYVADTLGARAITLDSVTVFRGLFKSYTTHQQYFLRP